MSSPQGGVQAIGIQDPNAKTTTWKLVLTRTYELYAAKFWTYFRIAIVPAVIAYAFSYFARIAIRQLVRASFFPPFSGKWLAMVTALEWTRGAIYWSISAFFFAAVSVTLMPRGAEDAQAVADAYTMPRKRLGAVAAVAVAARTLFYLGFALAGFAVAELMYRIAPRNYWAMFSGISLMVLALAGLLCKFGLAIPELMHNAHSTAGSAMKKSLKKTAGWEVFFMVFLVKSAAIGYAIYWVADQGLTWLWQHWTLNPSGFSWVEWSVYIFIAAVVETPLFIAFSVLYMELQEKAEAHGASATD
ncbi:MAG TPA: hypothetical protein VJW20_23020 [Candidatus Angelobacter sp.]|nr:hypothetical protein [Candidatus Angelobacter sp.]